MPKTSRRKARATSSTRAIPSRSRTLPAWAGFLPVLLAVVLNLPNLRLGYFWDDFYFLTSKGSGDPRTYLLPQVGAAFYRPLSQGIYFFVLKIIDPSSGTLGHLLNLALLITSILLLVRLVSRLSGPRAGLLAGIVFASYGHIPSLVAWISCSQDLLAIVFILAAFLLRHEGKDIPALACATAALLCKEPALAAFPALVGWDWIVGRPTRRLPFQLVGYCLIALVWAFIHPGLHLLAGRGFRSGSTGYVGMEHPERWGLYLVRYMASLFNLPPPGLTWSWWAERAPYAITALALLIAGLLYLDRGARAKDDPESIPLKRMVALAGLFTVPTVLLPTLLIRHWAPYFTCIPALGVAMVLGPLFARLRPTLALAALATFLLLGSWYRGVRAREELVWSEPVFVDAADAVQVVRANFKRVLPTIERGSQIVASVGSTGARGIQSTLMDGQALSVWYGDPTLRTVTTLTRRPGASTEYLVRVTTDLNVIAIDPETHHVRSSTGEAPDLAEINRPLNNYARALAAGGERGRAVRILDGLARIEPGAPAAYDRRMIASIFIAADQRREADSLLATTPSFSRDDALAIMKRLLGEATADDRLDTAAFEAFGLSSADPETIRWLMNEFRKDGSRAQAAWYAERLQRLVPGDAESAGVLAEAARAGVKPSRTAI